MYLPLCLALVFLSCCDAFAEPQSGVLDSHAASEPPALQTYTRDQAAEQIGAVYDTVLDAMTSRYFRYFPDLDRDHTGPMRAFILEHQPREEFAKLILRENPSFVMRRDGIVEPTDDTRYSESDLRVMVAVAERIARMVVEQERGIYVSEFVDKNPIRLMLFEMDTGREYSDYISWVHGEVSAEDFKTDQFAGSYQFEEGDRIFAFESSADSWQNLCGRLGYIVVRNGKIHDVIVTLMN